MVKFSLSVMILLHDANIGRKTARRQEMLPEEMLRAAMDSVALRSVRQELALWDMYEFALMKKVNGQLESSGGRPLAVSTDRQAGIGRDVQLGSPAKLMLT
jgi:hypothetical protein